MNGFERTETGYRATDSQVAWWESRDMCPCCSAVVEPTMRLADGTWCYRHDCDGTVSWTRKASS